MSTASLPAYALPSLGRTPTYTAEPQAFEQRIALNRFRPRLSGEFTKQSKGGLVALRFLGQDENASLPVYGIGDTVHGIVDINKPDGVNTVEVKVKGTLRLKEIAEGGTVQHDLCHSRLSLWHKDRDPSPCPSTLSFSVPLPATFNDGHQDYPLPPSHEVHMNSLPGFRATVEYTVTAYVDRGIVKKATSFFPKQNDNTLSTEFIYYPRSRPALPLPGPMIPWPKAPGVVESPEWRVFPSVIPARSPGLQDVVAKLYIPASRVYCMSEPIPFHLTFQSTSFTLATFMPYGPMGSALNPTKQYTRIQLLRQSIVDVRNTVIFGTKTDIWRVSCIGNATFQRAADGAEFLSYFGEIRIAEDVKIPGFRAGGLSIRDCLLLTMTPPDITKSHFDELRCVVPVRLTTDPWSNDGSTNGPVLEPSEYSSPSSEEDASSQRFASYRDGHTS